MRKPQIYVTALVVVLAAVGIFSYIHFRGSSGPTTTTTSTTTTVPSTTSTTSATPTT